MNIYLAAHLWKDHPGHINTSYEDKLSAQKKVNWCIPLTDALHSVDMKKTSHNMNNHDQTLLDNMQVLWIIEQETASFYSVEVKLCHEGRQRHKKTTAEDFIIEEPDNIPTVATSMTVLPFISFPHSLPPLIISLRFPNLQSPLGPKKREHSHTHTTAPEKLSTWTKGRQLLSSREFNLRNLNSAIKEGHFLR